MTRKQKKFTLKIGSIKTPVKGNVHFYCMKLENTTSVYLRFYSVKKNRTFKIIFPFLKELKVKVLVFNLHYPFIVTCLWPTSGST